MPDPSQGHFAVMPVHDAIEYRIVHIIDQSARLWRDPYVERPFNIERKQRLQLMVIQAEREPTPNHRLRQAVAYD